MSDAREYLDLDAATLGPVDVSKPPREPRRVKLPDERKSITHHFVIYATEIRDDKTVAIQVDGYITVGLYDNGTPGEVFVTLGKTGGRVGALLDMCCVAVSLGLQCGMPLDWVTDKFRGQQFEPQGPTGTPGIRKCASLIDYVAQWLELRFGGD